MSTHHVTPLTASDPSFLIFIVAVTVSPGAGLVFDKLKLVTAKSTSTGGGGGGGGGGGEVVGVGGPFIPSS
jgi:hypothetical protein